MVHPSMMEENGISHFLSQIHPTEAWMKLAKSGKDILPMYRGPTNQK
jgi:hypothetical protein